MDGKNELIVNSYCFGTSEDAELARQELKKIEYLEQHMDYDSPRNMILVYQKAVKDNIFRTPIGWEYLKELRDKIYSNEESVTEKEDLPPVTLFTVFAYRAGGMKDGILPTGADKEKPLKQKSLKQKLITSVLINVMLVAAVIAMFAITLTSNHPNILNYKNAIINEYAGWQHELTERENIVREKERELLEQE